MELSTCFGRRALIVATNHCGELEAGKPTGVFASELTAPYYAFIDAGMNVDTASPAGWVDPGRPAIDQVRHPLRRPTTASWPTMSCGPRSPTRWPSATLDMADYDLVYLAGGWGAAFDFGFSEPLAAPGHPRPTRLGKVIGGICHGPLGSAQRRRAPTVEPLVEGPTDHRGDRQAGAASSASSPRRTTPRPSCGPWARCSSSATRFRDPLANHWVVDGNLVTGQNQNAGPMVAREMMRLVAVPVVDLREPPMTDISRPAATGRSTGPTPPSWPPPRPTTTGRCG